MFQNRLFSVLALVNSLVCTSYGTTNSVEQRPKMANCGLGEVSYLRWRGKEIRSVRILGAGDSVVRSEERVVHDTGFRVWRKVASTQSS